MTEKMAVTQQYVTAIFFLFYTQIKNVIQQLDNVVNILLVVARE